MRRILQTLAAAAIQAVALSAEARAADLGRLMPFRFDAGPVTSPFTTGFYAGGRQMLGGLQDTGFATGSAAFTTRYGLARQTGVFVGYGFGPLMGVISPRLELEGSFGTQSVDRHTVTGLGQAARVDSFGDLQSWTGFVNGFLDVNAGQILGASRDNFLWRLTPFVGGGVGASSVTLSRQGVSATGVVMDGSATRFSWHGTVGLGVQIFEATTLEISYRHMRTEGLSFTARDGTNSKTNMISNMATIGIRRSF